MRKHFQEICACFRMVNGCTPRLLFFALAKIKEWKQSTFLNTFMLSIPFCQVFQSSLPDDDDTNFFSGCDECVTSFCFSPADREEVEQLKMSRKRKKRGLFWKAWLQSDGWRFLKKNPPTEWGVSGARASRAGLLNFGREAKSNLHEPCLCRCHCSCHCRCRCTNAPEIKIDDRSTWQHPKNRGIQEMEIHIFP